MGWVFKFVAEGVDVEIEEDTLHAMADKCCSVQVQGELVHMGLAHALRRYWGLQPPDIFQLCFFRSEAFEDTFARHTMEGIGKESELDLTKLRALNVPQLAAPPALVLYDDLNVIICSAQGRALFFSSTQFPCPCCLGMFREAFVTHATHDDSVPMGVDLMTVLSGYQVN